MDKNELKQILREQFEPLENATQKKLAYLQSDNVFTMNNNDLEAEEIPVTDSSLENAFSNFSVAEPLPAYEEPKEADVNIARDVSDIKKHKQNIAARIAAMKGFSMPEDYLGNK